MKRSNGSIGLVTTAILTLFLLSSVVGADPASGHSGHFVQNGQGQFLAEVGHSRAANDLMIKTAPDTDGYAIAETGRSGDLKAPTVRDDDWEAVPFGGTNKLTSGRRQLNNGNDCFVDFNDQTVLQYLPDHAINTFVSNPFWIQQCDAPDEAMRIRPVGTISHFHLNYEDPAVGWCNDLGTTGRHIDGSAGCDSIDPVTEPRSGAQMHQTGLGVRLYAYQYGPGPDPRLQFNLNQIRVLSGEFEICFVQSDGPWITAEPTDQHAGYCGTVGAGNWDLSAAVVDAYEVRIYSLTHDAVFTDVGITTL